MKSFKYIEHLLNKRCFPDFLKALNFKVDLKEWTECVGMANRIMGVAKDKDIDVTFDIGCGRRPTLGTLLALNVASLSNVVCIDPQLDISLAGEIKGLTLHNSTLQDYLGKNPTISFNNALICCNHSHVSRKELFKLMNHCKSWAYVTCPCCVDNKLTNGLYFRDKHIWSPKNEIYVFEGQN